MPRQRNLTLSAEYHRMVADINAVQTCPYWITYSPKGEYDRIVPTLKKAEEYVARYPHNVVYEVNVEQKTSKRTF